MSKRNAIVIAGGWDGHSPVEQSQLFVPFLREAGFDVTVEDSLETYADLDLMLAQDLVVQCWTMGEILVDELRGLRAAVEHGTGLAGWHGGLLDSFRLATDYTQMLGAQFSAHPHDLVDHEITITQPEHPITRGLESFHLTSEQYWVLTDPAIDVLATTTIPVREGDPWHEGVTFPAAWTRNWGAGRIFATTTGHTAADLSIPAVRTMIERGMLWAARTP